MSTIKRLITVTLASALVSALIGVGLPAAARADPGTVHLSSGPGVIFEECADHPISYSVSPPSDAWNWSIELILQAPTALPAVRPS